MPASRYYVESRSPRYSVLFALPLLLAYEALAWFLAGDREGGVRNGADVIFKSVFLWLGGPRAVLAFEVGLLALGAWIVVRDWRMHPGRLQIGTFFGMLGESSVLAVLVGVVLGRLTATVVQALAMPHGPGLDTPTQLMVSLGAGIYEELLFRVVVVGTLAAVGSRVLGWSARTAGIVACIIGALLFSAFHYVGPYGDTLELSSFVFRFLAGVTFSALYLLRGFGITAWTHALYDVFVTLGV